MMTTTNSWTNADGEPIMDGAAWRFEQQLDIEYAEQRADWQMDDYSDDECDPWNNVCATDDEDCDTCRDYWLDHHAEGMREDAAMEFGLFGSEA
jgi:hypothetical protein